LAILSKTELLFLQGQKKVSKSYEYKLKSVIRKKLSKLVDKEIPLISSLFPTLNLDWSPKTNHNYDLTKNGQALRPSLFINAEIVFDTSAAEAIPDKD
jgi:hypothetical protein